MPQSCLLGVGPTPTDFSRTEVDVIERMFYARGMSGKGIVSLATRLAVADPASCDRAGLADLVEAITAARSWLDALETRVASASRRLGDTPTGLLTAGGRRSVRDAEAADRRRDVCELLPGVHDALAEGRVAGGHVDAVARLAASLDDAGRAELRALEATLVAAAARMSVEEHQREMQRLQRLLSRDDGVGHHERLRRQRHLKRWVDKVSGMCHTELVLDPLTDAKVAAVFDAAVTRECGRPGDDRSLDQLKADVVVDLIVRPPGDHGGRPVPEVVVLVDEATLGDGVHDRTVAETAPGQPVPVEAIRRLTCDGDLIPVVLNGDGVTLEHGRARRVATTAQRRALRVMYRTCGHPHCQVGFEHCDIHHAVPWQRGSVTDVANLLPLCSKNHHLVHEGGWHLALRPDRTIRLERPDGTVAFEGATVDVAPAGTANSIDQLIRARAHALAPPGHAA